MSQTYDILVKHLISLKIIIYHDVMCGAKDVSQNGQSHPGLCVHSLVFLYQKNSGDISVWFYRWLSAQTKVPLAFAMKQSLKKTYRLTGGTAHRD